MVISASEVEVRCQLGFPLLTMADVPVEIELFLDERESSAGWLQFRGHVTHVRPMTHSLVVHIDELPPPLVEIIDAYLAGRMPRADVVVIPEPAELDLPAEVCRE